MIRTGLDVTVLNLQEQRPRIETSISVGPAADLLIYGAPRNDGPVHLGTKTRRQ